MHLVYIKKFGNWEYLCELKDVKDLGRHLAENISEILQEQGDPEELKMKISVVRVAHPVDLPAKYPLPVFV